jgi:FkbM family methyltransferase
MTNSKVSPPLRFDRSTFLEKLRHAEFRWGSRKVELDAMISKLPLLLFGFGGKGQALAHHIRKYSKKELSIFDTSLEKRALARTQGFKVIDMLAADELSQYAVILGACQEQLAQRQVVGKNYIYYQEAASILGATHLENLAVDFQEHVHTHANQIYDISKNLTPESQVNMLAVLMFRLSLDPCDLQLSRRHNELMWMDIPSQFQSRPYDTFLDVGAYDGDTLRLFQQKFSCQRGIAVEANEKLFEDIQRASVNYKNGIEILPMAAWSKRTRLSFEELRFGMIKVTENDRGSLQAAPIDDFVSERIDILKMDIEGAEAQALEGSSKLLNCWRPDLAIAAYHRPKDFINLFEQLGKYGYHDRDFQWHFAHYSDCIDDSIYYVLRSENSLKSVI